MPTTTPPRHNSPHGAAIAVIGAAAVAICCAGPALLAAGVLGAIGAWLANPWVIAAAVVALITAVAAFVRRRSRRAHACCEDPSRR